MLENARLVSCALAVAALCGLCGCRSTAPPSRSGAHSTAEAMYGAEPYGVGGEISAPQLEKSVPVEPGEKAHGRVILQVVISREGKVETPEVIYSTSGRLDKPAIAAVSRWVYKPAMLRGHPVAVYQTITLDIEKQPER
jgi:TonB family protein